MPSQFGVDNTGNGRKWSYPSATVRFPGRCSHSSVSVANTLPHHSLEIHWIPSGISLSQRIPNPEMLHPHEFKPRIQPKTEWIQLPLTSSKHSLEEHPVEVDALQVTPCRYCDVKTSNSTQISSRRHLECVDFNTVFFLWLGPNPESNKTKVPQR